jgi:hypothetical protein
MIAEHFVVTPDLLRLFAAIHPNASWEQAIALMQALQEKGFDAPKSEEDDLPSEAAEFTQVWSHNNEEAAMVHFARGRMGTITMATLTWTLGVNHSSSQAVEAVKQALADLSKTLGPAYAVLDQIAAWVKDGETGSGHEMTATACWSREGATGSDPTLIAKEYKTARRELTDPIDLSVVLEKDASKRWIVIGALSV